MRAARPVECADRADYVRVLDGRVDFIDANLPRGQGLRIELDAHGIFLRAVDLHLRDALHHRDSLGEHRLGILIDGVERQRLSNRARDTGSAGPAGFTLLIGRRSGHVRRKLRCRASDRGLHVLRRGVDFAAQVELQSDLVEPKRARGVIESMPAIVENCFSSGVAMAEAIVSGFAPGKRRPKPGSWGNPRWAGR